MRPWTTALRVVPVAALLLPSSDGRAQARAVITADSTPAAVDRIFARWNHTDSPSCALGVSRNGTPVYTRGYGMANLEYDLAISPASVFHLASVSKQFTALAVLLLAQGGKLTLDDDVRRYVPELPDYGHRITLRHLLTHTSGLRDEWDLLALARGHFDEELITESDVLDVVTRQRALNFVPGAEYLYSNTGFTLAGLVVRRVSGQSLRDFAEARIFAPLGMRRTHFHDDHTMVVKNRTSAYEPGPPGAWKVQRAAIRHLRSDESPFHRRRSPRLGGAPRPTPGERCCASPRDADQCHSHQWRLDRLRARAGHADLP